MQCAVTMADAKARRAMLEAKRKRLRELRQLTAQRAQARCVRVRAFAVAACC